MKQAALITAVVFTLASTAFGQSAADVNKREISKVFNEYLTAM